MRTSLLLTAVALAAAPVSVRPTEILPPAPSVYMPRLLTAQAAATDVALLRRALETIHPGLYRYQDKVAIDRAFTRLESAVINGIDELGFHREIAILLAAVHCDHTKPELPEAIEKFRDRNPTHLPLRFHLIEGRMIVVGTDGQAGAPPVGSEILSVNGTPAPRVLGTIGQAVAYDGDTDQAIAAKLSDDSDLSGDDFNEYYPSFYGMPSRWTIAWKPIGAREATTSELRAIPFTRWTAITTPTGRYREEFYKSVTWRLSGKTARLRVDTFVNYRNPVQPTAFLGGFFRAMKAAGTDHLILDLRANGGGSEDVSIALGRYLLPEPFIWSKPVRFKAIRFGDLPQYIDSWGDRDALFSPPEADFVRTAEGWYDRKPDIGADEADDDVSTIAHQLSPDRFSGRLTILSGPRNGSGATRTIAQLKERRGATVLGEDTSGSAEGPTAGHIFLLTLPQSGIRVRIPDAWNRTNIAAFRPRLGVAVDRLVVPTLADFEAGRDAPLQAALALPALPADRTGVIERAVNGHWKGTLEYRDYGNDLRVVLPTKLDAKHLQWDWTYDDGPGRTVSSREGWALTSSGTSVLMRERGRSSTKKVVQLDTDPKAGLTLVLDGTADENGKAVKSRTILSQWGDRLRITTTTQAHGEPFLMRHSYELRRVDPTS